MADTSDNEALQRGETVDVANEFAHVKIRKVATRNGERLEIIAPRLEKHIRLDALELESLTWQTTETFTKFLETPFGPLQSESDPKR